MRNFISKSNARLSTSVFSLLNHRYFSSGVLADEPSPKFTLKSHQETITPKMHITGVKPNKRFVCDWDGCCKTYGRKEHLKRHQLIRKSSFPFVSSLSFLLTVHNAVRLCFS